MSRQRQFTKGFGRGFKSFGHGVSAIMNSALLLAVYIIGVGLTSVLAKVSGKHFLETKVQKGEKSYWSDLNLKKRPIEDYYRQF